MISKFSKGVVALTAIVAAAALTLSGPAKAQVAAGFDQDGSNIIHGFGWNVNSGAVAHATNGTGGSNVALFGVSADASHFIGVADAASDGLFHPAEWSGVNAAPTVAYQDSGSTANSGGVGQGFDTPWGINNSGAAIGQGVGQIAGYDQGFFVAILWNSAGLVAADANSFVGGQAGGPYGGQIWEDGFDFTGFIVGANINTNGDSTGEAFQNFGSFFYQGVVNRGGNIFVIPYFDSNDVAARSTSISQGSAITGYNFQNSLSIAVGYTATVNSSPYTYTAGGGGSGNLTSYGQGPNGNFIWGLDTNDASGTGTGQVVGFDIDGSGSFNRDVYAANKSTSVEVADNLGGNTSFLVGVSSDGTSSGFETSAADGEAFFHAWGTKTGTPGAAVAYPEPGGTVGSKAFYISSGGAAGPVVSSITIKGKPKHGKPIKGTITLTGPAGAGGLVVAVTDSIATDLAPFTVTVPAGQTSVAYKSGKLAKTSKHHVEHLIANPGGVNSVTFTVK